MMLMVVSGRSGSGKSIALRVLEDLGYYCVDNLPVNLLPQLVKTVDSNQQDIAVSIDVRNMPDDPEEIRKTLDSLGDQLDVNVIYLDADDKELVKRYSETRRLHPLSRGQHESGTGDPIRKCPV